jgi:release factor glutamine methyltransferase
VQLRQVLQTAIEKLSSASVPSPRMNAELLLMFMLGCDRAYLFAHPERELTSNEMSRYDAVLAERSRGMPAQYITGHQEFWGMDLIVTPAVLIPRPETEHVIETVLQTLDLGPQTMDESMKLSEVRGPQSKVRIVDVGTGSGCIALALARELPHAEIHATDNSSAALEIARANAARHQFESRIQFHQGDLLEGLNPPFDVIVSNPPYVGDSEEDQVQLEVRKFEPRSAVFAGPTGTEVISGLIEQSKAVLCAGGWLIMELSGTIAGRVQALLGGWDAVEVTPDLQSIPRVVRARKR